MITFFVALITAIVYAWWIGNHSDYLPIAFRLFVGLVWGIIVVLAICVDVGCLPEWMKL